MRQRSNQCRDLQESSEPDPSIAMCSAFMDTLMSIDLALLSEAVADVSCEAEAADPAGERRQERSAR